MISLWKKQAQKFFRQRWGILLVAAVLLLTGFIPLALRHPAQNLTLPNLIQKENERPGTTDWKLSHPAEYNPKTFRTLSLSTLTQSFRK